MATWSRLGINFLNGLQWHKFCKIRNTFEHIFCIYLSFVFTRDVARIAVWLIAVILDVNWILLQESEYDFRYSHPSVVSNSHKRHKPLNWTRWAFVTPFVIMLISSSQILCENTICYEMPIMDYTFSYAKLYSKWNEPVIMSCLGKVKLCALRRTITSIARQSTSP